MNNPNNATHESELSLAHYPLESGQNKAEVSIIIPVFNTEKYLRQCIDSACQQTFKDIEILIIDDASTDNSLSIIREYQSLDPRIGVIVFQQNRGSGAARNAALEKASARYIMFLDSDDWLELDAVEQLHKKVSQQNFEMVMFGYVWQSAWDTAGHGNRQNRIIKTPVLEDDEPNFFRYMMQQRKGLSFMAWQFIYERNALLKTQLLFPEGIYFEDVTFVSKAAYLFKHVGILKQGLYNYRYRPNSITQAVSKKKIRDWHQSLFLVKKFLEEQGIYPQYEKEYLIRYLQHAVCGSHYDYLRLPQQERDETLDKYMQDLREGELLSDANLSMIQQAITELDDDESDTKKTYEWLYQTGHSLKHSYTIFKYKSIFMNYLILAWLTLPSLLESAKNLSPFSRSAVKSQ